jgi:HAD superfamily phosphatase (TIGR01681 family)
MPANAIKVVAFDADDTLWCQVDEPRIAPKFTRLDDRRAADDGGFAQELVENAREVLKKLVDNGYVLVFVTMGPEDQVSAFAKAFGIDRFFDFKLSAFDREDKADKISKILKKGKRRLKLKPSEIVYVDDNPSYLATVKARFPDLKTVWAHYRMAPGLLALNDDMEEMHRTHLW